ncbi:hypothetical protein [Klebsiella phage Kpn74]|uniref:Uncharacterized protein n=1 Tax=Klebsiella phage Kpn74 TaxID=3044026 RepID=A0AAT9V516_9CAUD|nr:hypothetical protein [Klebsiella phage Kpn74]
MGLQQLGCRGFKLIRNGRSIRLNQCIDDDLDDLLRCLARCASFCGFSHFLFVADEVIPGQAADEYGGAKQLGFNDGWLRFKQRGFQRGQVIFVFHR